MNVRFVIERLVRHQAVLLAELATSGGARAPLSELLDQTFLHLAQELDERGISRKVSADMFGMALRAYLKKIQRLAESSTDRGTSLWEAVLRYVSEHGGVSRAKILERFSRDDEAQVRAVLFDLVESGLCTSSGSGASAMFELASLSPKRLTAPETFVDLLWLVIFREGPLLREDLVKRSAQREADVEAALQILLGSGRIVQAGDGAAARYSSSDFVRPVGENSGWEAAVLDHYQALVSTVRAVLSRQTKGHSSDDHAGGFTYAFDVWDGHPLEEEVKETLNRQRSQLSDLREKVDAENQRLGRPQAFREVTVYGGQSSRERNVPR